MLLDSASQVSAVQLYHTGNSLERIQQYLDIEHEPPSTPDGIPPAYWPASGELEVKNLSARYSSVSLFF